MCEESKKLKVLRNVRIIGWVMICVGLIAFVAGPYFLYEPQDETSLIRIVTTIVVSVLSIVLGWVLLRASKIH